jgi:hypothetical protein
MARTQWPKTDEEWEAMLASSRRGFVRTAKQWEALLKSKKNPLTGVPKKAVDQFTKSLLFKEGGLAHADYSSIVDRLSYPRFKRVWESFGLSMSLFADHEGYKCVAQGDCESWNNHICTSNCRTLSPSPGDLGRPLPEA